MMKNIFFIFASFGWISASKVEIEENKLQEKTQHISEDIAGNFENFENFFTAIGKDHVACNYYAPNQARCQRVFVNIGALTKNPSWMKIDLQTIMPELEGGEEKIWLLMELKRTYKLFDTTVLREYKVKHFHFYFILSPKYDRVFLAVESRDLSQAILRVSSFPKLSDG